MIDASWWTAQLGLGTGAHRARHPRAVGARSGFTLVDFVLVLIILAVLLAVLIATLSRVRRRSSQTGDATCQRQLHNAFLVWSRQAEGRFPTPRVITAMLGPTGRDGRSRADAINAADAVDPTIETHAALYAACISQNYFSPALCVSHAEVNPHVSVMASYNFNIYNAAQGTLWDPNFKADLATTSHLSFGTLHLFGERSAAEWRESLNGSFVVLGNRGVRDGRTDPATYDASLTLRIHGPTSSWEGNLVFNDNHVEFATSFTPASLTPLGPAGVPDNLFRDDPEGAGADVWLTMIRGVSRGADGGITADLSWD